MPAPLDLVGSAQQGADFVNSILNAKAHRDALKQGLAMKDQMSQIREQSLLEKVANAEMTRDLYKNRTDEMGQASSAKLAEQKDEFDKRQGNALKEFQDKLDESKKQHDALNDVAQQRIGLLQDQVQSLIDSRETKKEKDSAPTPDALLRHSDEMTSLGKDLYEKADDTDTNRPNFLNMMRTNMANARGLMAPQAAQAAPQAQPAPVRVKVKAPNGKLFSLPQEQLEQAKQQGYELAPQ